MLLSPAFGSCDERHQLGDEFHTRHQSQNILLKDHKQFHLRNDAKLDRAGNQKENKYNGAKYQTNCFIAAVILDVTHGRVRWIADAVPVGWRGIVVVVVVVVDGREIVVVVVIDGREIVVVVVIDGREIVVVVAALLGCVGWPVFVSGVARKVVWVGTHGDKVGPLQLQHDGSILF